MPIPIVTAAPGSPSIVVFGDILAQMVTELDVTGATVGTRVPDPMPLIMVRLSRTGGTRTSPVSELVQVSVDVWADTEEIAHDAAQTVRTQVYEMQHTDHTLGRIPVYQVDEIGGPVLLPDPNTAHKPRYVATYELHTRGVTQYP